MQWFSSVLIPYLAIAKASERYLRRWHLPVSTIWLLTAHEVGERISTCLLGLILFVRREAFEKIE